MGDRGDIDRVRRVYAEEVCFAGGIRRAEVVDAFAKVPRERFLGPPPWRAATPGRGYRDAPDDDPRHTYHNVVFAIDEKRKLNNGHPSFVGMLIDESGAKSGDHVVHVGCATGYYTAILAELVGESGRVTAIEVDDELAARGRANLAYLPHVEVVSADGSAFDPTAANAILVNAGATHPAPLWLERLLPSARLILPLTVEAPLRGAGAVLKATREMQSLGAGAVLMVTREMRGLSARFISTVAIYHCAGARDDELGSRLADAFARGPAESAKVRSVRQDRHAPDESCWFHTNDFCVSTRLLS